MTHSSDRDGIVTGTDGNDSIGKSYVDSDGDRIDNPDNPTNDDTIIAGAGNDCVYAGEGDDTVFGGSGHDYINGGAGDDVLNGEAGNDKIIGGEGCDIINGGDGNDRADGGAHYDHLNMGDGDDCARGGDGDDTVIGGDGNDWLEGNAGDDTVHGGDGSDVVIGGSGDDTLTGGAGDDCLDGGSGDDILVGGAGDDSLHGGSGEDDLYGGDGDDHLSGGSDDDVLCGDGGDDTLSGGSGDDVLVGGAGDDILSGGSGDDTIYGGADDDVMIGGSGNDNFFSTGGDDTVIGGATNSHYGTDDNGYDTLTVQGPLHVTIDGHTFTIEPGEDFTAPDADGHITTSDGSVITFVDIDRIRSVDHIDDPEVCDPPICFTPGALVATPTGERRVEDLRVGDKVVTRDNGLQEIRWVGHRKMTPREMLTKPELRPIMIQAGSLGPNLPERDMMVSPSHRMLIANERTSLYFAETEVLVAAKHLVNGRNIHRVDMATTTYIHMLFDQHEVLLSNGAWTESFQPGDYSLGGLGDKQRNEVFALFPSLKTSTGTEAYTCARPTLKRKEAELLTF